MRRLVLALVPLALVLTGSAAADHLDPQERIRPADQARARAMLLRVSDLAPGYRVERTSGLEPHLACPALDESALTVSGQARTPYWSRDLRIVSSAAVVYATIADSRAAWAKSTSAAGLRCVRNAFRTSLGEPLRVGLTRLALPRVAQQTVAYRLTLSGPQAQGLRLFVDVVLLRQGRAQSALLLASLAAPPTRADEVELARLVGRRMASAMRGA